MQGRLGRVDRGALEGTGPATLVVDGDDVVGGDGDVRGHAATLAHAARGPATSSGADGERGHSAGFADDLAGPSRA
ncbi:hypothetical protein Ccel01_16160 [Cellulosimicrobium cellulans]|uniref:Uncharacterized protein n=1 Tax=Cellulosimicrobium cellulans TaxID=1710 RepID=A0AAV5P3J4_CELCE|nr:hypothetical protein Ccel01_16160 [Cellulosimicrobium cellulans]